MDPNNKAKLDALLQGKYEEQIEAKRQEAEKAARQTADLNAFRSIAKGVIDPVLNEYTEHLKGRSVIATRTFKDAGHSNPPEDPRFTFEVPLPGISYGRSGPSSLTFSLSRHRGTVIVYEKVSSATITRTGSDTPDIKLAEVTPERIEAIVFQFVEKVLTQK